MATRSNIGIKEKDGVVWTHYCHWDGYPAGVGKMLRNHYTTEAQVRELLALGPLSSLGASLDATEAYGDEDEPRTFAPGRFEVENEYAYVFDVLSGAWLYAIHGDATLRPLTSAAYKE